MSDFGAMKTRIAAELMAGGRSDLEPQVEDAIRTAIRHYEARPFWFNKGSATSATTPGDHVVPLPATMLAAELIRIDYGSGFIGIDRKDFRTLQRKRDFNQGSGKPFIWTEYDGEVLVWQTPDAAYDLEWYGVVTLDALSDDANTNAWMTTGEELIRQRARAIVQIDVLKDAEAKAEALQIAAMGGTTRFCLSLMERTALTSLVRETRRKGAQGSVKPG
jgi:hypothetical protein